MIINIHGTNLELTPALRAYAEEKISGLTKYFDNITQADIDIGRNTNHHQKGDVYFAEVNLHVPGQILRVVKEEEDLYKAIDKVKDHMKDQLSTLKGKMRNRDREEIRGQKEYDGGEE